MLCQLEQNTVESAKLNGEINDALQSKESYLELLGAKHETYRYKEEAACSSSIDEGAGKLTGHLLNEYNKEGSKVRKSARVDMDFKRIGTLDEFSEISFYSQAKLSSFYPSKHKNTKRKIYFDT